jgi:hypothetical protein
MSREYGFVESLTESQILLLRKIVNFQFSVITLDFDEILFNTQEPVKKAFFERTGFDYRSRKIDRWSALANWALADGWEKTQEEATAFEASVWADKAIFELAKPNVEIQRYSQEAFLRGVKQIVVTTRIPELKNSTFDSLTRFYPWLKEICIRDKKESEGGLNGDVFKGIIAADVGSELHFDDSVSSGRKVLELSPASLAMFPRSLELGVFNGNDRVIEFSNMDLLNLVC